MNQEKAAILILGSILLISGCCKPGTEQELMYDDGTFEDSKPAYTGVMLLNEFSAPSEIRILRIKWWVGTGGYASPFELVILDSQGNLIWSARTEGTRSGWNTFELSDVVLVDQGTFYVGAKWEWMEFPLLGNDLSNPDGKSWWLYDEEWHPVTDKDYAFRVVICEWEE